MKYVILEKSQVKGFTRTRKGKMERVKPFERKGIRATAQKLGIPVNRGKMYFTRENWDKINESQGRKKSEDNQVENATMRFAEDIIKQPKNKQEKWADKIGYKKYAKIFDTLSDDAHNDAMDEVWSIVRANNE